MFSSDFTAPHLVVETLSYVAGSRPMLPSTPERFHQTLREARDLGFIRMAVLDPIPSDGPGSYWVVTPAGRALLRVVLEERRRALLRGW